MSLLYCRLWSVQLYHNFLNCFIKGNREKLQIKLNISTAIFHGIYTQFQTNSSNKINFTDIPLYYILQQQFYKNIIKLDFRVDIFITC